MAPQAAVYAAAWVRGGGSQVQAVDEGFGPAETRDGPEDQLLVQCGGAAVEGSADEVGVAVLQVGWGQDAAGQDAVGEPWRGLLDFLLHVVGHPLGVGVVPTAGDVLAGGVAADVLGDVGVRPLRFGAGGGPGWGRRWSSVR